MRATPNPATQARNSLSMDLCWHLALLSLALCWSTRVETRDRAKVDSMHRQILFDGVSPVGCIDAKQFACKCQGVVCNPVAFSSVSIRAGSAQDWLTTGAACKSASMADLLTGLLVPSQGIQWHCSHPSVYNDNAVRNPATWGGIDPKYDATHSHRSQCLTSVVLLHQ